MKQLAEFGGTGNHWFYLLLVPLVWAGCSLLHFCHHGDEYAMYAISSGAGSWILFVIRIGDIHNPLIPISAALVGGLVMAAVGCLLVRLKVRKALWAGLFCASAVAIFLLTLSSFPSIERALSKNGSWWAYICSAIELGMYCAVVLSVAVTIAGRLLWRGRAGRKGRGSDIKTPEVLE